MDNCFHCSSVWIHVNTITFKGMWLQLAGLDLTIVRVFTPCYASLIKVNNKDCMRNPTIDLVLRRTFTAASDTDRKPKQVSIRLFHSQRMVHVKDTNRRVFLREKKGNLYTRFLIKVPPKRTAHDSACAPATLLSFRNVTQLVWLISHLDIRAAVSGLSVWVWYFKMHGRCFRCVCDIWKSHLVRHSAQDCDQNTASLLHNFP